MYSGQHVRLHSRQLFAACVPCDAQDSLLRSPRQATTRLPGSFKLFLHGSLHLALDVRPAAVFRGGCFLGARLGCTA